MLDLEHKFAPIAAVDTISGMGVEGYASYFGLTDQGRDVVAPGAYAASLARLAANGGRVKMLWQHDAAMPIGVWDQVSEDAKGLYVKGRLLAGVAKAEEAASLLKAGAIDGLSIGYRTIKATKDAEGRRHLLELDLWEVSLVTFPMLPEARVGAKGDAPLDADLRQIAGALRAARAQLAARSAAPNTDQPKQSPRKHRYETC